MYDTVHYLSFYSWYVRCGSSPLHLLHTESQLKNATIIKRKPSVEHQHQRCLTRNADRKIHEAKTYSFSSPLLPPGPWVFGLHRSATGSTNPWEKNSPASGDEQGEIRCGREEEKDEVGAWSEGLVHAPTCSDRLLKFNALQSLPRTWFYAFAFLFPLTSGFRLRSLNREICAGLTCSYTAQLLHCYSCHSNENNLHEWILQNVIYNFDFPKTLVSGL